MRDWGRAIDRVHQVGVTRDRCGLVGLQLADEVPAQVEAFGRRSLGRGFLIPVLSDVTNAEPSEPAHVITRPGLRHDDQRDLARVAPGGVTGRIDAGLHLGEIRRELGGARVAHPLCLSTITPAWRPVIASRR